jgi:hypothetical protein
MEVTMHPESVQETLDRLILENMNDRILPFFRFAHLPSHLAMVSEQYAALACGIIGNLPRNAERTVALRKLLESKDAGVRAKLAGAEDIGATVK